MPVPWPWAAAWLLLPLGLAGGAGLQADTARGGSSARRLAAARDVPQWVKSAPVLEEDPETSELPYPLDLQPSTWDGPQLTRLGREQLRAAGGTPPPASPSQTAATSSAVGTSPATAGSSGR